MPEHVKLKYHQPTLDLLGRQSVLSRAALKKIEAVEKKAKLKLPASVREWYSLTDSDVDTSSRFMEMASLAALLTNLQTANGWLVFGEGDGISDRWYVNLDGGEDPEVIQADRQAIVVAQSFSAFIFGLNWEEKYRLHEPHLVAAKLSFGPPHLDFLKERYSEGVAHLSEGNDGTGEPSRMVPLDAGPFSESYRLPYTLYPFFSSDGALAVRCADDPTEREVPATWFFWADSADALARFVAPLWQFVGQALRAKSREGELALAQLKRKPAPARAHANMVKSVAFSADGLWIVSGGALDGVKVWDSATGWETTFSSRITSGVQSIAFSPDGQRLVGAGGDLVVGSAGGIGHRARLAVWDATSGKKILSLRGHKGTVNSAAFSPDGKRIVSGGEDQLVKVWNAATGKEILSLAGHERSVSSVAFSPDGKRIVSGSYDGTVKVWDPPSRKARLSLNAGHSHMQERGHGFYVESVAFSPDGERIVSSGADCMVRVWNAVTGREIQRIRGHKSSVNCVAFSPDGKRIVSGSHDMTVKVWNALTGKEMLSIKAHSDAVSSVAFSPDGKRIVSGSHDKTVKLWDAASGKLILSLRGAV